MVSTIRPRAVRGAISVAICAMASAVLVGCPVEIPPDNQPPIAEITSHYSGQWVDEGYEIVFLGTVADPDDQTSTLVGTWYLAETSIKADGEEMPEEGTFTPTGEELCAAVNPFTDGSVPCTVDAGLLPGTAIIQFVATDPAGNNTVSEIILTVNPTSTPTAEVLAPLANDILYRDIPITFEGIVRDEEDSSRVLEVWWSSDIDGDLGDTIEADFTGRVATEATLSEGNHEISLHAIDTTGKEGVGYTDITVGPPNTPPECELLTPLDNPTLQEDELLELSGNATDIDIPNNNLFVSWISDIDGLLGASRPNIDGLAQFNTLPSAGSHTITMQVEDELGALCEDTLTAFINSPPIVQIAQPVPGANFSQAVTVPFSGTLWDAQDDLSELTVKWSSNLDGTLHTDPPSATGVTAFDASNLSLGTHAIKLTVTDTHGASGEAFATITIF